MFDCVESRSIGETNESGEVTKVNVIPDCLKKRPVNIRFTSRIMVTEVDVLILAQKELAYYLNEIVK